MPHRPLQFGPDPNRTYSERWNEMHPDRYGRPDCSVNSGHDWQEMHDTDAGGDSQKFLGSLLSLAILVLAPLAGATATLLIYRWATPSQLTTALILGYAAIFLATAWVGATLVYALRRLLLAATVAGSTVGIGYLAWTLWLS